MKDIGAGLNERLRKLQAKAKKEAEMAAKQEAENKQAEEQSPTENI